MSIVLMYNLHIIK